MTEENVTEVESVEQGQGETSGEPEVQDSREEEAKEAFFGPPGDAAQGLSLNDAFKKVTEEEAPSEPVEGEEGEAKPKKIFKFGDVEVDGSQTVEINGDSVPVEELINDYHGRKEITRRFTEFDKNKKAWEQEVLSKFKEQALPQADAVRKISEAATKGDYLKALTSIADMSGKDPIEAEQAFVKQALDLADKFTEMTEDEVRTYWAERKMKHTQSKLETKEKQEKEKQTQAEIQAKVKETINKNGLSENQFAEALSFLKQDENIMNQLKSLTPEQAATRVCMFYHDSAKEARIEKAVNEAAPDYPNKDVLIDKLFRVADYDYSVEDIKEVVSQVLAMEKGKTAETPSKEAAPKSEKGTPATPEKTNSSGISNLTALEPEDALGWDFT